MVARWRDALVAVVVAVVIGLPALATNNGFASDYTNHLWLVWVQAHMVADHGAASYFINAPEAGGVFYPLFEFYGGTLYASTGAFAAALGGRPIIAFVGSILLASLAAYGGFVWLARQLGARSWMGHTPAVTFVTSAYYVTNLYGRGAWPEFVAVSAIPLLVASGVWIARAPALRPLPCLLFSVAAVFWSGSHNITLAWGAVALILVALALRLVGRRPLAAGRAQLGWVAALLVLGVCVNGWFLVPDILHAGDTIISVNSKFSWHTAGEFNTARVLFDPLRHVPASSTTPALYVQLPFWGLLWSIVTLLALRATMPSSLRRGALAISLVLAFFIALILIPAPWALVPEQLRLIQFAYRLASYVALLTAGLVLVAVLAVQAAGPRLPQRPLAGGLAGAMLISAGLCLWQLWVPETRQSSSYVDVRDALVSPVEAPRTWYDAGGYLDASQPVVRFAADRVLHLPAGAVQGNSATFEVTPPPGRAPFAVNTGASPALVRMTGLERLGRTSSGYAVVRRPDAGSGPVTLTLEAAGSARAVGAVLSVIGVVGILAIVAYAGVRGRRRRVAAVAR